VCTLKSPSQVIVPPVATIYVGSGKSDLFPESVTIQPCVASTYTKVTETPLVDKTALIADPPILEPFLPTVILLVANVFA
jgi:hypothetical protein